MEGQIRRVLQQPYCTWACCGSILSFQKPLEVFASTDFSSTFHLEAGWVGAHTFKKDQCQVGDYSSFLFYRVKHRWDHWC